MIMLTPPRTKYGHATELNKKKSFKDRLFTIWTLYFILLFAWNTVRCIGVFLLQMIQSFHLKTTYADLFYVTEFEYFLIFQAI